MSLLDLVQQQLTPDRVQQISQQVGADPAQTEQGIQAAIPMLVGGMAGNARQPEGLGAISQAMGQAGGAGGIGGMLGGLLGGAGGGGLGGLLGGLGGLLGGHEGTVESGVQQASGLDSSQTKKLLMILAPIVLAALAQRHSQRQREQEVPIPGATAGGAADLNANGIPDHLEQEARQAHEQTVQRQPQLGGIIGSILNAAQRPPRH